MRILKTLTENLKQKVLCSAFFLKLFPETSPCFNVICHVHWKWIYRVTNLCLKCVQHKSHYSYFLK